LTGLFHRFGHLPTIRWRGCDAAQTKLLPIAKLALQHWNSMESLPMPACLRLETASGDRKKGIKLSMADVFSKTALHPSGKRGRS